MITIFLLLLSRSDEIVPFLYFYKPPFSVLVTDEPPNSWICHSNWTLWIMFNCLTTLCFLLSWSNKKREFCAKITVNLKDIPLDLPQAAEASCLLQVNFWRNLLLVRVNRASDYYSQTLWTPDYRFRQTWKIYILAKVMICFLMLNKLI